MTEDQERFARTAPPTKPTPGWIWFLLGVITGLLLAIAMSPLPN